MHLDTCVFRNCIQFVVNLVEFRISVVRIAFSSILNNLYEGKETSLRRETKIEYVVSSLKLWKLENKNEKP